MGYDGHVAAGFVQAGDKSNLDRIDRYSKDDRDRLSSRLCCQCRGGAAGRGNHGDLTLNKFSRKYRQSIVLSFPPAIFDVQLFTLGIPHLFPSFREDTPPTPINLTPPVVNPPKQAVAFL